MEVIVVAPRVPPVEGIKSRQQTCPSGVRRLISHPGNVLNRCTGTGGSLVVQLSRAARRDRRRSENSQRPPPLHPFWPRGEPSRWRVDRLGAVQLTRSWDIESF